MNISININILFLTIAISVVSINKPANTKGDIAKPEWCTLLIALEINIQ